MIPSIDSYLYNEIESKLRIFLENRYIIEEILKDIQPRVANNFMRRYAGEKGEEIPIVYTMPQDKQTQQGAIYIGLREGEETDTSIGNTEDFYLFKQGAYREDESLIHETDDKKRLYFEVSEPIGELDVIRNFEFSREDNVTIEGNRVYFAYDPELATIPDKFKVVYTATVEEEVGLKQGFTATEYYSVLVVSTNMDTVRCLDLVVKAILILMRSNPEELTNNLLQRLKFGQIEEINLGREDGSNPEILYGRETIVSYKTSYNLDAPLLDKLEKIMVNMKVEGGE